MTAGLGHNSEGASQADVLTKAAQGRLRSFVERVERMNEAKAEVIADIKEIYAEAKGEGYDVKIIRKVVHIRAQDRAKVDEEAALIDLYMSAIGMGEL